MLKLGLVTSSPTVRLKDHNRAVQLRRNASGDGPQPPNRLAASIDLSDLPYQQYDWSQAHGACCENAIGYMPIPVGAAGQLLVDGIPYHVPMVTTEGVLAASIMRGCKAINLTPVASSPNLERAAAAKIWLDSTKCQRMMKRAFDSTSRFARFSGITTILVGSQLFIRFKATAGDAMEMNMTSKGAEAALTMMGKEGFPDMYILSLSGNYCADKKAAAVNWIEVPADVLSFVLIIDVDTLVKLIQVKNLVGSAVAGALGSFNAHAANIVATVFIATGQDGAQIAESASCLTTMMNVQGELHISVSMPSLEVATAGGGTVLRLQSTMHNMLGVRGPHTRNPGDNAGRLARIIAAAVLAGEVSLCSALAAGQLVRSHMLYNRKGSA
ncbi:hypothetical protein OIDMADRAFT_46252 [Oidiodendron maius Zn]|uniref:hydroxymethylglutaryl-CoA reductase (NADPH) n=1 Tax=Oidiodendron maius (strain Zn) TaxID=913774 RepID=A0A0C3GB97_OIDMZ|nr:hypothetical protein OIDMADRAFT_46252 [Oidiodendron maius Zn]